MYTYICIYIHMCVYTDIREHAYKHVYMYICPFSSIYVPAQASLLRLDSHW